MTPDLHEQVPPDDPRARIARRLGRQARSCGGLGSVLYERLLEAAADDVVAGGPAWEVLEGRATDAPGSALGLRLMGAVHRLVLLGQAPALGRHYPTAGGRATGDAWPALK